MKGQLSAHKTCAERNWSGRWCGVQVPVSPSFTMELMSLFPSLLKGNDRVLGGGGRGGEVVQAGHESQE